MSAWLISILNQFGYFGIAFLIAVENIFPPIPSEIILTFSGFMTTKTTMTPFLVIIAATIGALLGAYVLYFIGHFFSEDKIFQLIDSRLGKMLGFKKESFHKTVVWFEKNGKYGTLFGRCVPVIRSLISIPAGMVKMPLLQFTLYTTIGSLTWNTILVLLGNAMGENWQDVVTIFNNYSTLVTIVLAIVAVGVILYFILNKSKRK